MSAGIRLRRLLPATMAVLLPVTPVFAQAPQPAPQKDTAPPAAAGRGAENVIRQADDAFGASIGRETIGIYSSTSVRGFSPVTAGNARIEGLYFDQVWGLWGRIRRASSVRVGLSALGFPFPAPTGVIDYAFRTPGDVPRRAATVSGDSYGNASVELEIEQPLLPGVLRAGGAFGRYRNEFYNGTDSRQHIEAVSLRWTPTPAIEVVPFWVRSFLDDDEAGPIYVPAGDFLPPKIERRRYNGPDWATYRGEAINYGGFGRAELSPDWQLRAGVFRSIYDDERSFSQLLLELTPDGRARRLVIADPPSKIASTNGELRLSRRIDDGPRLHVLHAAVRGRDRRKRFDGSQAIDLGATTIDERIDPPRPEFAFGEQTRDRVEQLTAGLAYEGRWPGVGELSAGVQKTDYRKRIVQPGLPATETAADPWLYNATLAAYLSPDLAVYAGYARGLEESGVAPPNAVNRNEALPAIVTSQRDAGLRYALNDRLRLIAGVFEVRKPYFNLDAAGRFAELGDIENQGLEMSLSGALSAQVDVVAGALLLRPRVTGEGVRLGRVGERPVDIPERSVNLNADWRVPGIDGLSLDAGITHTGALYATRNNRVRIPAITLVDIGARYRFRLAGQDATLRAAVTNLGDEQGFDLRGAGAYDLTPGRVFRSYLVVDF